MKYKIGIIIIGISFLIALNPFLVLYAIPFFILGLGFTWISKKEIMVKIAWTIIPLLLWEPCTELSLKLYLSYKEKTRPKYDFIFPAAFVGTAIIVEDIPCAGKPDKKEGRIQLEFPDNGILLYKERIESSFLDEKYYIKSTNGNLIKLINFGRQNSEQANLGVRHKYSGVSNLYLPDRFIYTYQVMTVGLEDKVDSIIVTPQKREEMEILVKKCITK